MSILCHHNISHKPKKGNIIKDFRKSALTFSQKKYSY